MKSLADLQQTFCDALLSPEAPPPELLDELLDDGLSLQRFNVYRNNFVVLNGDALADMYPVVKRLVGDSAFRMLATAYVRQYPPRERTLLLYGDSFPEFLAKIPEFSTLAYLPDVARLEYMWTAAYHSEEAEAVAKQEVASINADEFATLRLVPHPSMQCIRSDYPIYRIWVASQTDEYGELISLDEGPSHVILIRPRTKVETREVGEGTFLFLFRLQAGDSIDDAYSFATRADASFDLTVFFARHLFDGTFSSIQKLNT